MKLSCVSELATDEIYEFSHEWMSMAYAPLTRFFHVSEYGSEVSEEWRKEAANPVNVPEFILKKGFDEERKKLKIRLNITSKCNLNCAYCSVSAKTGAWQHMSRETALSAMSQAIEFARSEGMTEIELAFSGGEPTLLPWLMKDVISFTDDALESGKITLVTKLLTNGVLSERTALELAPYFNGVQVSWDGFLDNHPRYGKESAKISSRVWDSLGAFVGAWSNVNLAIVASPQNSQKLGEVTDQVHETFGIEDMTIALSDTLWRGANGDWLDYVSLRKEYIRLWTKYRDKGIDIPLTGTDIHSISQYPCWVSAPNFSISPNGQISSCTVSFNDTDDFAKGYDIWRIGRHALDLDLDRISRFQWITVQSLSKCSKCFAKWHCRWGCAYANRNMPLPDINPGRCDFVRKVIADKIRILSGFGHV